MRIPDYLAAGLTVVAWLINPILGIFSAVLFVSFLNQRFTRFAPVFSVLVVLTVIIYQLSLPMPSDLASMKFNFGSASSDSNYAAAKMTNDFLSYGAHALMSRLFPNQSISFYLLNTLIMFFCLFGIYKYEKKEITSWELQSALLVGLMLGILDFQESHHYLRQSAAVMIFFLSFYPKKLSLRIVLILASVLWHGSTIILVPAVFLPYLFKKDSYLVMGLVVSLIVVAIISQINLYEYFKAEDFTSHDMDFPTFFQRFFKYFRNPQYAVYFTHSKELGNMSLRVYLVMSFIALGWAFYKKVFRSPVVSLIIVLTLWMVLFQHHALIFPRVIYCLEVSLAFFVIMQVKRLPSWKFSPAIVLLFCFLKIHLFAWPISIEWQGKYLFLQSPIVLLSDFKNWEINR